MPHLSGLASADDLKVIYAKRSKQFDEKTIGASNAEALKLKIEGEIADGWQIHRQNKASVRMVKAKPTDRQLEDNVWCLLYRLGFKELNEDRNFTIPSGGGAPPRQLDVFAADDETVFIVECTHAKDGSVKSVRTLIDKLCGLREDIVKAVHSHYGRSPKLKVKVAIATTNTAWSQADVDRASAAGIPLLGQDDIRYFNKLADILKTAARYQFLGRYFRDEKVEGLKGKVPATRGRVGKTTFYNFLISPHDLLRLAYISHRSKVSSNDDLDTYQRMVKPARLAEIGKFIDGGGTFPTNIVVNFRTTGPLNFEKSQDWGETATGTLTLPAQYGMAWVIDGQHRLYGYAHAGRKEEEDRSVVSVLAYENLDIPDEIQMFVDINTKQVKVKGNLVKEIISTQNFNDKDPRRRLEALYARIALQLDDYASSPLRDRILTVSLDKTHQRCITVTSVADGLRQAKLLGTIHKSPNGALTWLAGPLTDPSCDVILSLNKATETLSGLYKIFAEALPSHWQLGDAKGGYLSTNLGLRALLLVFAEIAAFLEGKSGEKFYSLPASSIIARLKGYLEPLAQYFATADDKLIAAFRGRGSSLQSVDYNAMQMLSIIYESRPDFDLPKVVQFMESRDAAGTKDAKDKIDEINRIIFEDVLATLKDHFGTERDAWWIHGVPKAVRNECDKEFNERPGQHERWQFMYLRHYPAILTYEGNWDLFKDRYNFYGKGTKEKLVRWIGRLVKCRTITHHAEKGPLDKEDVEFVRAVYDLVKEHIEGQVPVPGTQLLERAVPSVEAA